MTEPTITTFAERLELIDQIYSMSGVWPEFMLHDPVAGALLGKVARSFPELCVVATVADRVVAHGRAIPFRWNDPDRHRELPAGGWDQVLAWGIDDHADDQIPDTVSALEVAVDPAWRGTGLSGLLLASMREAAGQAGFAELLAPVRPNHKHLHPELPMIEYIRQLRPDGLPVDPWLRVHVRAGGVVEQVAPVSMVIAGSLAQWREWTGLPFNAAGPVLVPLALEPVHCDLGHDYAVYVEPNVWVRHRLLP